MRSTRRRFFQAMGTGAAGLTLGSKGASSASAATVKATGKEAQDGPVLLVGDDIAVADTRHGKVRGYVLRGIHYFLGE